MHLFKDNTQLACAQKKLGCGFPACALVGAFGRSQAQHHPPARRAPSPRRHSTFARSTPELEGWGWMERAALHQGSSHRPPSCRHRWGYEEAGSFSTISRCRTYSAKTFLRCVVQQRPSTQKSNKYCRGGQQAGTTDSGQRERQPPGCQHQLFSCFMKLHKANPNR